MRLLLIGDCPTFIGGVTNYTRPLSQTLSKEMDVNYLYSSTRTGNMDLFKKAKIVHRSNILKGVKCFELINGKSQYLNYHDPSLDYSNWFDKLFNEFLDEVNPDIVHINEIFGFSSNVINILKLRGIKCVVSVHEYWWLCMHRVMVDFNRHICEGPIDLDKCMFCVQCRNGKSRNINTLKDTLKAKAPAFFNMVLFLKKLITKNHIQGGLDFLDLQLPPSKDVELSTKLNKRLVANIEALNNSTTVIAVSSDVKNILERYGVSSEKIVVQHIGSTIAENVIRHIKPLNKDLISFGFIGGITYYKGVHQFVEAYLRLPNSYKEKCELNIFGKYDSMYKREIDNITEACGGIKNVYFHGAYSPVELMEITNKIDICVLPSLCADTAPQTIFESFSAGLPVICPKIGGYPDFVSDKINGLLYRAADVEDLKNCLIRIIDHPDLIEQFRVNIPKLKKMQDHCQELAHLFKEILQK